MINTGSIEERHVPHGPGLILGVHVDSVPTVKLDGLVIGMTNSAANVDLGIPAHRLPTPLTGSGVGLE
jgi:hypothetical protein